MDAERRDRVQVSHRQRRASPDPLACPFVCGRSVLMQ